MELGVFYLKKRRVRKKVSRISINKNTFNYQAFRTAGIRELKKYKHSLRELWKWYMHIETKFINLLLESQSSTEIYFIIECYVNTKYYARHFHIKIWIFSFFSKTRAQRTTKRWEVAVFKEPWDVFTLRTEEAPCEETTRGLEPIKLTTRWKHSVGGYIKQLGKPSQNTIGWVAQTTDILSSYNSEREEYKNRA